MSENAKNPSAQEKAINDYLEALLQEVPDDDSAEPTVSPQVSQQAAEPAAEVLPHEEPEEAPPVVGLEQLVAQVPEVITEVETVTETQIEQVVEKAIEEPVIEESGVPEWAQSRFQCLLFNVSGLSLAVPLVKLNSVIPWNEDITHTPNQTEWYLGLIQHLQNQIKVIDTALLVMPENRRHKIEEDPNQRFSHILLVDNYRWGLACDSIGDVIWLEKDDVKWRKDKSSRAWLSGTSLEHLCAIMDTEVFAQMLNKAK